MLHYWEGSSQPFPKLHQDLAVCKLLEYCLKLKELMLKNESLIVEFQHQGQMKQTKNNNNNNNVLE